MIKDRGYLVIYMNSGDAYRIDTGDDEYFWNLLFQAAQDPNVRRFSLGNDPDDPNGFGIRPKERHPETFDIGWAEVAFALVAIFGVCSAVYTLSSIVRFLWRLS